MRRRVPLILVLPLFAAACGLKGPLDRPPPMFGKNKAQYQAELNREKAQKEAEKKKAKPPGGDQPAAPPPIAPIGSGPLAPPAPP